MENILELIEKVTLIRGKISELVKVKNRVTGKVVEVDLTSDETIKELLKVIEFKILNLPLNK